MRYIVKGQELQEYMNNVYKMLDNELLYTINEIRDLAKNTEWEGPSKSAFVNKYDSIIREIDKIPEAINLSNEYISGMLNNFDDTIDDVKKKFDNLNDEIEMGDKQV